MSTLRLLLLSLVVGLASMQIGAAAPRRVLQVSLYPFIPEPAAAALALKQGFERLHPDVRVDIVLNQNYYKTDPAAKGLLLEDADVHEIDSIFLADVIQSHRIAPLSTRFTSTLGKLVPIADSSARVGRRLVAVPHWICSDFLIYRVDQPGLGGIHRLSDLETDLGLDHGLLMDMKGEGALGEIYLNTLLARDGSPEAALNEFATQPDPTILERLKRVLALEPSGFGRDADYGARGSFYARQFARRGGRAFLGYSEMTHEVLDESAVSCRLEDRCVTAADIGVAAFPFQDNKIRPAVWVDMFGIDARAHGRARRDAEDFIRYAVSARAYRALLVPQNGGAPRYLLPAMEAPFHDPQILAAAPLYPRFRAIIDQGVAVTAPHLNARLHALGAEIDADLPRIH